MAGSYSIDQEDIDGEDGAQYGRIQTRNPFSHKKSAHGVVDPSDAPYRVDEGPHQGSVGPAMPIPVRTPVSMALRTPLQLCSS